MSELSSEVLASIDSIDTSKSLREIAAPFGLTSKQVQAMQYRHSVDVKEAVRMCLEIRLKENEAYEVEKGVYKTVKDLALDYGKTDKDVKKIIEEADGDFGIVMSVLNKSLETLKSGRATAVLPDGSTVTAREFCIKYRIPIAGLMTYKSKNKLSFQETVDHYVSISGNTYESMYRFVESNNISLHSVRRYLNSNNLSLDEAREYILSNIDDFRMRPKKDSTIVVDGRNLSRSEFCELVDIKENTFLERMRFLETDKYQDVVDYFLSKCEKKRDRSYVRVAKRPIKETRTITVGGELKSLNSYCGEVGIDYNTICKIMKDFEVSSNEAVELYFDQDKLSKIRNKRYGYCATVRGTVYYGMQDILNAIPISQVSLNAYMRNKGVSLQEAVDYYIKYVDEHTIRYDGKEFKSVKSYIQYKGYSYYSIQSIMRDLNCSADEAIEEFEKRKTENSIVIDDGESVSISEFTRVYSIAITKVFRYARVNNIKAVDVCRKIYTGELDKNSFKPGLLTNTKKDEALNDTKEKFTPATYNVGDKQMTLSEACEYLNSKVFIIRQHSRRYKLSIQEVLDDCYRLKESGNYETFIYNGVVYCNESYFNNYISLKKLGELLGLATSEMYRYRDKYGSIQKVIDNVDEIKADRQMTFEGGVVVGGITYDNIEDALHAVKWTVFGLRSAMYSKSTDDYVMLLNERYDAIKTGKLSASLLAGICKDLCNIRKAYVSRSGVHYFYCTCKECKTKMLLSCFEVLDFEHSEDFCKFHEFDYNLFE